MTQIQTQIMYDDGEEEDGVVARLIPLHPTLPRCNLIQEIAQTEGYTVGRGSECDVCIDVPTLSQLHCRIIMVRVCMRTICTRRRRKGVLSCWIAARMVPTSME
jgi:hypothetical protein